MNGSSFPSPDRGPLFALRVVAFATLVPLLLKSRLPRLAEWLEPPVPPPTATPGTAERLTRRIDALLRLGRPLVRSGCLTRGITLYYFLRRAGVDVSLRFGVGEVDGAFAGHCWLARGGEPFAEARDPRPLFIETWAIGPGPASLEATLPGIRSADAHPARRAGTAAA